DLRLRAQRKHRLHGLGLSNNAHNSPVFAASSAITAHPARRCPRDATFMSQPNSRLPSLPIDASHVAMQFARRGDLSEAQLLYAEIARRMGDRLRIIRLQPQAVLDAGCGAGDNLPLLRERYPDAAYTGLDHCAPLPAQARARYAAERLGAWLRPLPGQHAPVEVIHRGRV